ncbi:MAG TPA: FAD-dependent oxidoreductase [Solirubrobacteraceae bacterium]|jgi:sulfide:quinone oxidoreductase
MSTAPRQPATPRRVLVAGGGVAALEAALALQAHAGDRVEITLLAPDRTFTYRPLAATEPFGGPEVVRFPLAGIAADRGISLIRDALAAVEPDRRRVRTQGGASLRYDALILALGAAATEGITGALTFRGPQDVAQVRRVVEAAAEGALSSVAFAAPGGATWTLPLYELALGMSSALAGGPRPQLVVVTPERRPLEVFGEPVAREIAAVLLSRGITLRTRSFAEAAAGGRLWMAMEGAFAADRVIALPRLVGRRIAGVPADGLGFIPVDEHGRVEGLDGVYAAGDGTNGPLKQGGLAAQQAARAAAAIAAEAGAVARHPEPPVLRAVLATGEGALYLRSPAAPGEPAVSAEPPWWPPSKIVARHLGPYLAANLRLAERHAPVGLVA